MFKPAKATNKVDPAPIYVVVSDGFISPPRYPLHLTCKDNQVCFYNGEDFFGDILLPKADIVTHAITSLDKAMVSLATTFLRFADGSCCSNELFYLKSFEQHALKLIDTSKDYGRQNKYMIIKDVSFSNVVDNSPAIIWYPLNKARSGQLPPDFKRRSEHLFLQDNKIVYRDEEGFFGNVMMPANASIVDAPLYNRYVSSFLMDKFIEFPDGSYCSNKLYHLDHYDEPALLVMNGPADLDTLNQGPRGYFMLMMEGHVINKFEMFPRYVSYCNEKATRHDVNEYTKLYSSCKPEVVVVDNRVFYHDGNKHFGEIHLPSAKVVNYPSSEAGDVAVVPKFLDFCNGTWCNNKLYFLPDYKSLALRIMNTNEDQSHLHFGTYLLLTDNIPRPLLTERIALLTPLNEEAELKTAEIQNDQAETDVNQFYKRYNEYHYSKLCLKDNRVCFVARINLSMVFYSFALPKALVITNPSTAYGVEYEAKFLRFEDGRYCSNQIFYLKQYNRLAIRLIRKPEDNYHSSFAHYQFITPDSDVFTHDV